MIYVLKAEGYEYCANQFHGCHISALLSYTLFISRPSSRLDVECPGHRFVQIKHSRLTALSSKSDKLFFGKHPS